MTIELAGPVFPIAARAALDRRTCLVVDPDAVARQAIVAALDVGGLTVVEAANLTVARAVLAAEAIGVVLVDLRLGSEDGMALVRELADRPETSVVILGAAADPSERVLGILGMEMGADDFVAKPFHGRELLARIKRRLEVSRQLGEHAAAAASATPAAPVAPAFAGRTLGRWTLVETTRDAVDTDGVCARLTDIEFSILYVLLLNRGRVLTRDEIHRYATGQPSRPPADRSVDVAISALRRKLAILGNRGIRTVHRVGYIIS